MKLWQAVNITDVKRKYLYYLKQGDLFLYAKNTATYKCYMVLQNNCYGKVDVVNLIDGNLTVLSSKEKIIPMNGSLHLSVPDEEDDFDLLPF